MYTKLVESFLLLQERNGMSIAANDELSRDEKVEKLCKKFNIKSPVLDTLELDGEQFTLLKTSKDDYAMDKDGTVYLLDKAQRVKQVPNYVIDHYNYNIRTANAMARAGEDPYDYMHDDPVFVQDGMKDELVTDYQINSVLDKNDPIVDFFKALIYTESDGTDKRFWNARKAQKLKKENDRKEARKFISVEVKNGTFKKAEDFEGYEDGNYTDEEAMFNILLKVGSTLQFAMDVNAHLYFNVYSEETYHYRATRLDPEESGGVVHVEWDDLSLYDENFTETPIVDLSTNTEISIDELINKIPEGKFRTLFVNNYKDIIKKAISDYIDKAGPSYCDFDY